jgi:hypothetical protein
LGTFDPDKVYAEVSPDLADLWGSRLGQTYTLHFRTGPLDPSLQFPYTSDASFITDKDNGVLAQVINLSSIPISLGTLTIDNLAQMYSENGYTFREKFLPDDAESWTFHPEVPRNQSTMVTIPACR